MAYEQAAGGQQNGIDPMLRPDASSVLGSKQYTASVQGSKPNAGSVLASIHTFPPSIFSAQASEQRGPNPVIQRVSNENPSRIESDFGLDSVAIALHTPNVRDQWDSNLEFLLSCLGFAVGLGNVWRFPTQSFKYGGGAFFIPYWIMLFLVAMPIFFVEVSLGQFSSAGQTTCWEFCPAAQGLGVGMTFVSCAISIYYNMIIAWAIYFILVSFNNHLPWEKCGDAEWASETCSTNVIRMTKKECTDVYNGIACEKGSCAPHGNATTEGCQVANGVCRVPNNDTLHMWDPSLAHKAGCSLHFPARDYFINYVLNVDEGEPSLENVGPLQPPLVGCLLLAWILTILCLVGGLKSTGKVVYVTATAPYLILAVLFVRGLMLDGALTGINYYLSPDFSKLLSAEVWQAAATQVCFSLSTSFGGLIALSSYNKFHDNIRKDNYFVCIGNCLTSVFAGFVVYAFLGFIAHEQGMDIAELSGGGADLVFGVYPFSITKLPGSPAWSVAFFVMICCLGVDSMFVLVETVVTALVDTFPDKLRGKKSLVVCAVSFVLFFPGLSMATPGGTSVLELVDKYSSGWNVLVIGALECVAINRYGLSRFIKDIELMIGFPIGPTEQKYWKLVWGVTTPAGVLILIIVNLYSMITKGVDKHAFYHYFVGLICMTATSCIFCPIVFAIYHISRAEGATIKEKIRKATRPTIYWGPAIIKHRIKVTKYIPDFVIDPEHPDNPFDHPRGKSPEDRITMPTPRLQSLFFPAAAETAL